MKKEEKCVRIGCDEVEPWHMQVQSAVADFLGKFSLNERYQLKQTSLHLLTTAPKYCFRVLAGQINNSKYLRTLFQPHQVYGKQQ